jgi:hypothetical protein
MVRGDEGGSFLFPLSILRRRAGNGMPKRRNATTRRIRATKNQNSSRIRSIIAITEAMRRVLIMRRSTQQTLMEGEIGVQWVDSVSLLVISMTSRVGPFGGGRINSQR